MGLVARRIRGALGMGLVWSVPWAVVGGVLGGVQISLMAIELPGAVLRSIWISGLVVWGVWGFVTGALFSIVLTAIGARRTVKVLRVPRFAAWGALAGIVPPIVVTTGSLLNGGFYSAAGTAVLAVVGGVLGAASAGSSLAIARSGSEPGRSDEGFALNPATGTGALESVAGYQLRAAPPE